MQSVSKRASDGIPNVTVWCYENVYTHHTVIFGIPL
jgi:hypothetical protein